MAPLIEALDAEHPGVEVERIDAAADPRRARALGVLGTPTLIGLIGGSEVTRITGRRGRAELEALFAGLDAGTLPGRSRKPSTESLLRAGAGALVAGIGAVTGPAWPLVAVGAVLGVYGLSGMIGRR
jgi:hypothetical protein